MRCIYVHIKQFFFGALCVLGNMSHWMVCSPGAFDRFTLYMMLDQMLLNGWMCCLDSCFFKRVFLLRSTLQHSVILPSPDYTNSLH